MRRHTAILVPIVLSLSACASADASLDDEDAVVAASELNVRNNPNLVYFGFYGAGGRNGQVGRKVGSGPEVEWDRSRQLINSVPSGINVMTASWKAPATVFETARARGVKVIVGTPTENNPPGSEVWRAFVEKVKPHRDVVLAYYVDDEPARRDTPVIDAEIRAIHEDLDLPGAPAKTFVVYSGERRFPDTMPKADYIGIDGYNADFENPETFQSKIAAAKKRRPLDGPPTSYFLVPGAFIGRDTDRLCDQGSKKVPCAPFFKDAKEQAALDAINKRRAAAALAVASNNKSVVGVLPFLYGDGVEENPRNGYVVLRNLGVENFPATLTFYREHAPKIVRR